MLIVLQTQQKGVPDNRLTSEPIAVLFVLQTQEKGIQDNREEGDIASIDTKSTQVGSTTFDDNFQIVVMQKSL